MLRVPRREPQPLASQLDRVALEVLARIERADGAFLEEVHLTAPADQHVAVRAGLEHRLEDFGVDGVDVRVRDGADTALVDCCFAHRRSDA